MMGSGSDRRQRVFVGDVQGCADELDALLAELDYEPDRHELWTVGDIVNRGPDSLRALRTVVQTGANSVLGNHDLHLLARWVGAREAAPGDTLEDVLEAPDAGELIEWLRARPPMVVWSDLILVHAGLHPGWDEPEDVARRVASTVDRDGEPMDDPDLAFMTTVRICDRNGDRPASTDSPVDRFQPWYEFYSGARTVVFGHWAQRGLIVKERLRGLDTGCVWGGRLTAWLAGEDRLVSVPALEQYRNPAED